MHSNITTTHLLQDTGCVAIPFVDVHPQTIAATLAVRSIPRRRDSSRRCNTTVLYS